MSIHGGAVTTRSMARGVARPPSRKTLFNPVTRRYVLDTRRNRESIAEQQARADAPRGSWSGRATIFNPLTERDILDTRQNRARIARAVQRNRNIVRARNKRRAQRADRMQRERDAWESRGRRLDAELGANRPEVRAIAVRAAMRKLRNFRAKRQRLRELLLSAVLERVFKQPGTGTFQITEYELPSLDQLVKEAIGSTLEPVPEIALVRRLFDPAAVSRGGTQTERSKRAWIKLRDTAERALAERIAADPPDHPVARVRCHWEFQRRENFTETESEERGADIVFASDESGETEHGWHASTNLMRFQGNGDVESWLAAIRRMDPFKIDEITNPERGTHDQNEVNETTKDTRPRGSSPDRIDSADQYAVHSITIRCFGGGDGLQSLDQVPAFIKNKRSIIKVINPNDALCGQRCLVLALLDAKGEKNKRKHMTRPARDTKWLREAQKLGKQIGCEGAMDFSAFSNFAAKFDARVCIWDNFTEPCYTTGSDTSKFTVHLFYDNEHTHYHYITEPDRLVPNKQVCPDCGCSHYSRKKHRCQWNTHCNHCGTHFKGADAAKQLLKHNTQLTRGQKMELVCEKCNHWAQSAECAAKHAEICTGQNWFCHECAGAGKNPWMPQSERKVHFKIGEHGNDICQMCNGETIKCECCGEHVPSDHRCHMQRMAEPKSSPEEQLAELENTDPNAKVEREFVVFDFESFINLEGSSKTAKGHEVNAVCWRNIRTGEQQYVEGPKALQRFAEFCYNSGKTTFIAHNGRGYDFVLLSSELHRQFGIYPKKICNGSKIMMMKLKNNTFVDSLNHVAARLSAFPKTFNLGVEVRKGYYPYAFDTPETQDYVGPVPEKKHFLPNSMSVTERSEFEEWHAEQLLSGKVWNLREERRLYCQNDVHILAEAMKEFMKTGIKETGINPLTCTTIASYVMRTYRTNYLSEKRIGVLTKEEREFAQRGFFGGRTDIINPLFELTEQQISDGWKIRYDDIVSLYPSVMWNSPMPVGHPTIRTDFENFTEEQCATLIMNKDTFGFADVTVQPPTDLIHPVLPGKDEEGKLNFTLHKQRHVWTCIELKEAVTRGYRILQIHELHNYKQDGQLFQSIIKKFFKAKQESSWGGGTDEELDAFIQQTEDEYKIKLDRTQCRKNPGRRALAKLILNSLWGKFAQRTTLIKDTILFKMEDWQKMLEKHDNGQINIKSERVLNRNTQREALHVQYVDLLAKNDGSFNVNHALAAHVTAHARLRLYDEMRKVGDNLLGHDTDSLWYAVPPGGYEIPEGDQLGQWEPEDITTGGWSIVGVVGTGPKSYAMKLRFDYKDRESIVAANEKSLVERISKLEACMGPEPSAEQRELFEQTCLRMVQHSKKGTIETRVTAITDGQPTFESHDKAKEYVKTKGVTLNSANAIKIHYDSMVRVVKTKDVIIAQGTALKRRRNNQTGEFDIVSLPDQERHKIVQFTANKRVPTPNEKHLSGFTVPRGYRNP